MNAKQKYLFDLNGYLHLKDVLATITLAALEKGDVVIAPIASGWIRTKLRVS